jgi:hypothetical protein
MPAAVVASRVGGLKLPLTATLRDPACPGDPALAIFGRYLQAVLTAHLGAGWAAIAPKEPIVRNVFFHDPNRGDYSDNKTPALYVFREGSAKEPERQSEDYTVHFDSIRCFWVFAPIDQFKQAPRESFAHLVGKEIEQACRIGRDPSFLIAGDPDPSAPDEGAVLLRHTGWSGAIAGKWIIGKIGIQIGEIGQRQQLLIRPVVDLKVAVEERVEQRYGIDPDDPTAGYGAPFVAPSQIQGVFTVDGLVVAEMRGLTGYGMLYVKDGADAQTIGTTPTKLTGFASAGPSAGVAASVSEDSITVDSAGPYRVGASFAVTGTAGRVAKLRLRRNGVEDASPGAIVTLAASPVTGALNATIDCAAGDVLTIFAEADVDATSLTLIDAAFVLDRANAN